MPRRISFLLICTVIAGSSWEARGAEIIMVPVSASGPHTIVGTEIRLASSGQRVRFEVQIKDFAPELLKVFQGKFDSRGYFNTGSVNVQASFVDCPSEDTTGHQFCRSVFGESGVGAPRCDDPDGEFGAGLRCDAGWINQSRTDWIMYGHEAIAAVDISSPDFRWGSVVPSGDEVSDEGLAYYGGTFMVDVPTGAVGSFRIGWDDNAESFLLNPTGTPILPLILTSAKIIILCANDGQCDDQSNCTNEQCNLTTNECEFTHLPDDLECDDGNACTLDGHCSLGKCVPQSTVTCNNAIECHFAGTCIPETGECSSPVPKPDGTACSDNDACTVSDRCLQSVCTSGAPIQCTGPCQVGTCVNGGCPIRTNGSACNDSNPCTVGDRCVSGSCLPTGQLTCTNGDACNNPGTCIHTGECSAPTPKPSGTSCSDNNPCTLNDACNQGVCQSGPLRDCIGLPCREDSCDPLTGQCRPVPNGTVCNDSSACTLNDHCVAGACVATSVVQCTGDACHYPGTCNPATGVCSMSVPKPDGSVCHDGDLCTVSYCYAGVCDIEEIHNCIRWNVFFSCIDGPQNPTQTACDPFDLNFDGFVDLLDVAILIPRY